ncbi:MAG: nuclear transport factor 2 family protein [Deltaproteobacteria bacterium]
MKKKTFLSMALLAMLLGSGSARAEGPKVDPTLADAVKRFNDTFNRFDAKATAAFWAEEGTLISPAGEVGKGRAAVETVYAHDIEMFLKGTTSTFRIDSARALKGGYALLDMSHEIQNARMPDGSTGTMKLHTLILAQKKGGSWQWLDARPYAFLRPPAAK